MLEILNQVDSDLLLWINGMHAHILDPWVRRFSKAGPWVVMYAAIVWMIFRSCGWRRALVFVAGAALAVGLSDYICASVIRPVVCRLRPSNLDNPLSAMVHVVDGYRSGMYGFPSCHGANTFALAVFTSLLFRQRVYTAWIFLWALAQCWSRAYLGVHYPGDLLVGALLGSIFAILSYMAACRVSVRLIGSNDRPEPISIKETMPAIVAGMAICIFLAF